MKKLVLSIIFILFLLNTNLVFAMNGYIDESLKNLELEKYDYSIQKFFQDDEKSGIKFSEIVKKVISGDFKEIGFSGILNYILNSLFKEIFINSKIIKNVTIIAILCAFLKILTESFKNQGVGEVGFYAGYMVIAMLLITSFNIVIGIILDTIGVVSGMINSLLPLLAGILIMSGAIGSASVFSGFIITAINIVSFIIKNMFLPLISSMVILNIVNYITPKEVLNKLIDFLKWITTFSLRAMATLFAFIVSIQRLSSPMLNSTINKTAKTFINFVPFVGDAITGAIDGVMHFIGLIKGGVAVGILIFILIAVSVPIIKLIAFIFIYKITAILIEPISDSRITSCIDCIGEYTKMILSTLILFVILFIFFIVVMLTISG